MLCVNFFSLRRDTMVKVYIHDLSELPEVDRLFDIDLINHFLKVEDAKL